MIKPDQAGLLPAQLAGHLVQTPEADKGRDDGRDGTGHIGAGVGDGRGDFGRQGCMRRGGSDQDEGNDSAQAHSEVLFHRGFSVETVRDCTRLTTAFHNVGGQSAEITNPRYPLADKGRPNPQ